MHMHNSHSNPQCSNRILNPLLNPLRNSDTPMRPIMTTNTNRNLLLPALPITLPLLLPLPKVEQIVNSIAHRFSRPRVLHNVVLNNGADAGVEGA